MPICDGEQQLDLLKNLVGVSSTIIVGIDLGTSNSVVSVDRGGKVETIPNTEGLKVTPSVVAFISSHPIESPS